MNELPETHPNYVYCILQGAGIVSPGRPIRGNFYCYKLKRRDERELRRRVDEYGSGSEETLYFVTKHAIQWSQRMDPRGYEAK